MDRNPAEPAEGLDGSSNAVRSRPGRRERDHGGCQRMGDRGSCRRDLAWLCGCRSRERPPPRRSSSGGGSDPRPRLRVGLQGCRGVPERGIRHRARVRGSGLPGGDGVLRIRLLDDAAADRGMSLGPRGAVELRRALLGRARSGQCGLRAGTRFVPRRMRRDRPQRQGFGLRDVLPLGWPHLYQAGAEGGRQVPRQFRMQGSAYRGPCRLPRRADFRGVHVCPRRSSSLLPVLQGEVCRGGRRLLRHDEVVRGRLPRESDRVTSPGGRPLRQLRCPAA